MKNLSFLVIACLLNIYSFANSPVVLQGGDNPSLFVDFDECVSWFNGYNEDYSEFTALSTVVENCSALEMAGPGYVYRNNTKTNVHSCTPGVDSTSLGMCVTALDNCNYIPGDSTSLIFEVRVIPGPTGMGSLEEISFYEQAPLEFNFYQGSNGTNNYPTKFGIRVLVDGEEVYSEADLNTEREWNLRTFNFSNVEAFTVTDTTVFQFEILPYCLVGFDSPIQAWDIDNLLITAGCNNVNAGFVKVIGNVNICQDDTLSRVFSLEAENAFGPNLAWLVLDQAGEIIEILDNNEVDFDKYVNGIFSIYHIAYGDDINGLELGNTLDDIEGCYDLSSRIVIVNNKLEAGTLTLSDGSDQVEICSDDSQDNIVNLSLAGQVGIQTNYILLSDSLEILEVSLLPAFNLSALSEGSYSVIAITHNGQLLNAAPGNQIDQIQGCIAISNSIHIEKALLSAGTITLTNSVFCVGDGNVDLLDAEVTGAIGTHQRFIVTDADSTILSTPNLPIDLDLAVAGECLLWHISSIDSLVIEADMHISEIREGCFDLSEPASFLRINNTAGLVTLQGGLLQQTICVGDSLADLMIFENTGNAASAYQYVVTDNLNVVLSISDIDTIDFTNAPVGTCRVWGVAHDGSLVLEPGDIVSDTLAIGCVDFTTNFVEVIRVDDGVACGENACEVDGGLIDLFGSSFCVGDGESDLVDGDLMGAVGPFMQLVVTDADSTVIALPSAFGFDVDLAEAGTCIVWNVASLDTIQLEVGMTISDIDNDCFALSNGATFVRILNDGGMVSLDSGETTIEVCVGDSISNVLNFITSGNGQNYQYIITDTFDVILAIPTVSQVDFEDSLPGTCRVWGLAHNSVYNQLVGDTLSIVNVPGRCFDLSGNFIEVVKMDCTITLQAGSISLIDGTVEFCPGDSTGNVVNGDVTKYGFSSNLNIRSLHEINLDGDSQPDYIIAEGSDLDWLEHDGINNTLVTNALTHDFAFNFGASQFGDMDKDGDIDMVTVAFGTDNYDVFLLSNDGSNAFVSKELADGTWDSMSQEPKEIQLFDIENDGDLDIIAVNNIPNPLFTRKGVIYKNDGAGNFTVSNFDLGSPYTGMAVGHLNKNSDADIIVMNALNNQDSLFMFKDINTGNTKVLIDPNLSDNTFTDNSNVTKLVDMDDDGDLDIVVFNSSMVNVIYFNDGDASFTKMVLTSDIRVAPDTEIQDFDGDGDLDFTTLRGVQINDGAFNYTLVDYDFKLSNNNAHVLMSDVNGDGKLDLINGAGEWLEFSASGYAFDIIVNGASSGTSSWILTTEQGMILSIDDQNPPLEFELLPIGTYELYYIVYNGVLTGFAEGQNISDISGDFDLSNRIVLNSAPCVDECIVDGGFVDLFGSNYCVGDGVSDFVTGDVQGSIGAVQQIIVTDVDSVIIDLPSALNFDVDMAPAGVCIVWNLASNDSISLSLGMHIDAIQNECFDLSSGASFTRTANNAGTVSLTNGMTIDTVCAGDNIQDAFAFVSNGAVSDSFQFVITNNVNTVLALPLSNSFNFDVLPIGECRIYGIAYSGAFLVELGDSLTINMSTSGCFDISDNFITILKEDCTATLEAGVISLIDGSTFFCPGDTTGIAIAGELTNHTFGLGLTGGIGEVDIDGDIYPDYIMSSDKFIWIEYDEGSGEVTLNEIYTATSFISNFETVDIDSDGDFDIVYTTADAPQQVNLLINDGALNFTFTQVDTGIQNVSSFNPTDYDNDGDIDILVAARMPGNSDELRLYSNDGSLNFTKTVIASIDPIWDVEVADLDMNGEKDLIVSRNTGETTIIYYNPITSDEEVVLDAFVSGEPRLKVIDFDNDGDLDITSTAGGGLTLYKNQGSNNFEESVLITFLTGILYDIEDFDNDGDYDVIGDGGLYINNGLDEFTAAPVGTGMQHNIFTDVNADGLLDGLFAGGWIENGQSGFTFEINLTDASTASSSWLLTDGAGLIVSIEDQDPPLEYSLMPLGAYELYHIVFEGTVSGLVEGQNISALDGEFDLSNAITLNSLPCMDVCEVDGGTISTSTGQTSIAFCVGDSTPDSLFLSTSSLDTGYIYVVTDTSGLVFGFVEDGIIEFDNAPAGTYYVSGIAYQGTLLLEEEVDIDTAMISTLCNEISMNSIEVIAMDSGGPCGTQSNPDLSIVVNRVSESSQIFDIKNVSSDTIDVSDFWICLKGNDYRKIDGVVIECGGTTLMAPGDILGLNLSVSNADGEIAIYKSASFNDPNEMLHYVEWGASGHGRSDEAIAAGLWSAGDFVNAISNTKSIYFSGFGYSSASWNEGDTDLCGELLIQSDIVFSRVSDNSQVIDLENIGSDTIDVNDYYIEQAANAYRVGDLVVECGNGSRVLAPGDKVGLVVIPMSNVSGELALFTSAENSSFGFVADYVQWGDAGFPNESQAVASGVWISGAFVPSFTTGQSIYYDGEGDDVSDWEEGLTSMCGELPSNQKRIDVNIAPNPAIDQMSIKIMETQRTVTQMQIIDSNGKVIMSANMEMNKNDVYRMSIDQLAPGIYFLKMKSSNAVVTQRFMVVK